METLPTEAMKLAVYGDEHLTIDFLRGSVVLDKQCLTLPRKEYNMLALLVLHAGQIVPRSALLQQVWGYNPEAGTRTLDAYVRRLRKKLGPYANQYIETIFGVGYRFQPFRTPRFVLGKWQFVSYHQVREQAQQS